MTKNKIMKTYTCKYYSGVRIISTHIVREDGETVEVTYYSFDQPPRLFGCEVYSGSNYIVGSTKPSYSRNYKRYDKLPKKYYTTVADLMYKSVHVKWADIVGSEMTFDA